MLGSGSRRSGLSDEGGTDRARNAGVQRQQVFAGRDWPRELDVRRATDARLSQRAHKVSLTTPAGAAAGASATSASSVPSSTGTVIGNAGILRCRRSSLVWTMLSRARTFQVAQRILSCWTVAEDIPEYVRKNKERFSYMLRRRDRPSGGLLDLDRNLTQWDSDMFLEETEWKIGLRQ